jgi:hypothetical protein
MNAEMDGCGVAHPDGRERLTSVLQDGEADQSTRAMHMQDRKEE